MRKISEHDELKNLYIKTYEIIEKYKLVIDLYEKWADLFIKAYPPSRNGYKIVYSKLIDPTLKYKEPAKNAYEILYKEYECLHELMRLEIKKNR